VRAIKLDTLEEKVTAGNIGARVTPILRDFFALFLPQERDARADELAAGAAEYLARRLRDYEATKHNQIAPKRKQRAYRDIPSKDMHEIAWRALMWNALWDQGTREIDALTISDRQIEALEPICARLYSIFLSPDIAKANAAQAVDNARQELSRATGNQDAKQRNYWHLHIVINSISNYLIRNGD
jgi:hypothetical protein